MPNNFTNKLNRYCTPDGHCVFAPPPKKQNQWYTASSTPDNHMDVHLYGIVGGNLITAQKLLDEINKKQNLKTITVYISTLGGTFSDGLPIYNTLRQHKAHVTTINMGYAVSMGSHIMLAGDTIKTAQNALQMIHSPLTAIWTHTNAENLRKEADVLDKHEQVLITRYADKTGLSASKIKQLMQAETWYTADEALKINLVDEIIDAVNLDDIEDKMKSNGWRGATSLPPPKQSIFNHLLSGLSLRN